MPDKLDPIRFGLAFGILWGLAVFIMGLISIPFKWGSRFVSGLGSLYVGYASSIPGSVIGLAWALVDGFCFGFVLAWLYNKLGDYER